MRQESLCFYGKSSTVGINGVYNYLEVVKVFVMEMVVLKKKGRTPHGEPECVGGNLLCIARPQVKQGRNTKGCTRDMQYAMRVANTVHKE